MPRGENLAKYYFQKGTSGNPKGRPRTSIAAKELRRYTREHVSEVINKVMDMTTAELLELKRDKKTPSFESAIAAVMLKAKEDMDFSEIDRLLDRCIGKVPQKLEGEFVGKGGTPLIPANVVLQPVRPSGKAGK